MPSRILSAFLGIATTASLAIVGFPLVAYAHDKTAAAPAARINKAHHHPEEWKFTMPRGDPNQGRAIFEKFECYYCHEVRGQEFPYPVEDAPELSQIGALHPVEFFAESIMHPNAVVPKAYRESDGSSPMTNFAGKMTVQELIDVSAYLASLRPKDAAKTVRVAGKVVALVPSSDEIVLEHGKIGDFMDAMTMGYKVAFRGLLKGLKPGDRIRFIIDTDTRVIRKIEKVRH